MARSRSSTVNSQMPRASRPSLEGNPGRYRASEAPFDRPQDTGNGGIPVKMYESMGPVPSTARIASTLTPGNQGAFSSGVNNNDYKNERPASRMSAPRGRR
jgi:hypothetical protein